MGCCFNECTKEGVAQVFVKKVAYEAYPSWQTTAHAAECPTMEELLEYTGALDSRDPWGGQYELRCRTRDAPTGLVVHSRGEDGRANTADDIWSDR